MAEDKTLTQADVDKAVKDAVAEATKGLKQNLSDALDEAKDAKRKLRSASEIKPEDLTAAEEAQFIYLFHAWIRIVENGHYQFQSGMLEPQLWHGWVETARSLLGAPGGRRMWLTVRPRVRAAFAEFVDREVIPSAGADSAKNFLGSLVKA